MNQRPGPPKILFILHFLVLTGLSVWLWTRTPMSSDIDRSPASGQHYLFSSKHYLTLASDSPTNGPKVVAGKSEEYVPQVFRIILQVADQIAREDWYTPGVSTREYYTFLLASLTIPYHESRLIHFRYGGPENPCYPSVNDLSRIRKYSKPTAVRLEKYLAEEDLIPPCNEIDETELKKQLFLSPHYGDMGIMQLNARWHLDTLQDDILDVRKTINYGLAKVLYGKYSKLARNFAFEYLCLHEKNSDSVQLNYQALIRGAWAGPYNSGNSKKVNVCRFARSMNCVTSIKSKMDAGEKLSKYAWLERETSKWVDEVLNMGAVDQYKIEDIGKSCMWMSNDLGFGKSFLDVIETKKSLFHHYLDPESDEYKAFEEIILNFKNDTDSHTYLDKILQEDRPEALVQPNIALDGIRLFHCKTVDGGDCDGFEIREGIVKVGAKVFTKPDLVDTQMIKLVGHGTKINIIGEFDHEDRSSWLLIELEDGQQGWLNRLLVEEY